MEQVIVYDDPGTGSVSICMPNLACGLTIEEIAAKDVPEGLTFEIIDAALVPTDRTFRNSWKRGTGDIEVDMIGAQQIWMDKIRDVRNAKLDELDLAYMQADEQGDTQGKGDIATQKQVLRDIPQTFDLSVATTPEELKALWPQELPAAE